jgi:hypothetical protein
MTLVSGPTIAVTPRRPPRGRQASLRQRSSAITTLPIAGIAKTERCFDGACLERIHDLGLDESARKISPFGRDDEILNI